MSIKKKLWVKLNLHGNYAFDDTLTLKIQFSATMPKQLLPLFICLWRRNAVAFLQLCAFKEEEDDDDDNDDEKHE